MKKDLDLFSVLEYKSTAASKPEFYIVISKSQHENTNNTFLYNLYFINECRTFKRTFSELGAYFIRGELRVIG